MSRPSRELPPRGEAAEMQYDRFAHRYREAMDEAVSFVGQDHDFFSQAKARELRHLAGRLLGDCRSLHALDVGCGIGLTDRFLAGAFASLTGVDVSSRSLELAAQANPSVRYELSDGSRLPFSDKSFDLVFTICVVHVLPEEARPPFVAELRRVTRPPGLVAVFEHNPLNPLTRLVAGRCEFGRGTRMLRLASLRMLLETNGLAAAESGYMLLFPSARRRLLAIERALRRLPLGAQYYVATRRA